VYSDVTIGAVRAGVQSPARASPIRFSTSPNSGNWFGAMITLGLLRGKRRPMSLILPLTKTARKHRRYERPLRSLSRSIALLRPTGTGANATSVHAARMAQIALKLPSKSWSSKGSLADTRYLRPRSASDPRAKPVVYTRAAFISS